MFQSKWFRNLFFSYILVIVGCFVLYTSFIIFENYQINKMRIERKSEIVMDAVDSILEQRMLQAEHVVQNLNTSNTLKQLYLSSIMGTSLDSYVLTSIQDEVRGTVANGLDIYKTIIFMNNDSRAYSSSGIIILSNEFQEFSQDMPYVGYGTVNELFDFSNKRYSFRKNCLLYCDDYTYRNGKKAGTICILFDLSVLKKDIESVMDEGFSVEIRQEGKDGWLIGERQGKELIYPVEQIPDAQLSLYISNKATGDKDVVFYVIIYAICGFTIMFVLFAYRISRKYYQPIDQIEQIVGAKKTERDEMDEIILGIQNLIGEKNGYQEKMLTITPFAQTGILHGIVTGNMEKETVNVLSEEEYFDLMKPYYLVTVLNIAMHKLSTPQEARSCIKQVVKEISQEFSSDEIRIVYYMKDSNNAFLIMNTDHEKIPQNFFYEIYQYVTQKLAGHQVEITMGVEEMRNDISELKEACEGAMSVLEGILTTGRGEIYFKTGIGEETIDYYFPNDFQEKVKKYLKRNQTKELEELIDDIYQKNYDLAGNAKMYRALMDELHVSVMKVVKEVTQLHITHIQIEKYYALSTLKEVFEYYKVALVSIAETIQSTAKENDVTKELEKELFEYIEENYCDENLSLQALCDKFNVSSKYLLLLCKHKYGVTYLQYIQNKRIEKAQQLLREGVLSLTEIAIQCGYTNQLTFRRNFKAITGVNPSDARFKNFI